MYSSRKSKKASMIVVSGKTHSELVHLKWLMGARERRRISMDGAIREILGKARARGDVTAT